MKTFGSMFSGIEAASVAFKSLGWNAAWFSEIEPFPCAVLKHHYPDVPNHGDVTLLPQKILNEEVEAPEIIVGGSPCQAFSVAGKRNSMEDNRGNLTLTYVEVCNAVDKIREKRKEEPAIILWENVPGVLNTKDNAFGCFLGALAGEDVPLEPPGGKWTNAGEVLGPQRAIAWRILDAQYFGLAQRRKRVFVVASARKEFNPSKVLFEFEGLRRDSPPSRETRKETPDGIGRSIELGNKEKVKPVFGLPGNWIGRKPENGGNATEPMDNMSPCLTGTDKHSVVYENHPTDSRIKEVGETFPTATSRWGTGGGNVPIVNEITAIAFQQNTRDEVRLMGEDGQIAGAIQASHGMKQQNYIAASYQLRRITPTECERLQGFPDGYSQIPWKKKPAEECPDGPRYKALGNSWAVPVVRWIGERINNAIK